MLGNLKKFKDTLTYLCGCNSKVHGLNKNKLCIRSSKSSPAAMKICCSGIPGNS